MPLRAVVVDIEGTTSATDFVVRQLYPYSAARFGRWIDEHPDDPDTVRALSGVRTLIGEPDADTDRIVAVLRDWLAADRKVTPLKTLQGRIWQHGFAHGELVSHFYPDAIPALRGWRRAGHRLYVYSSGSVAAQRAWFGHSPDGDLRPLLAGYFDTENTGAKRATDSYRSISTAIGTDPAETVFLSDLVEELDAARLVGWHTVRVRRPGEPHYPAESNSHLEVGALSELDLSGDCPYSPRKAAK